MKLLASKHLVAAIKERQAREVAPLLKRGLRPKLAIIVTQDHPAINVYVRKKKEYGSDLGMLVDIHRVSQNEAPALLATLNRDQSVHGIIVQLPLRWPEETERLVSLVAPEKDVDALGSTAVFEPATPLAILWLLEGHGVDLQDKHVLLVGHGKLVGRPLERMLKNAGVNVFIADNKTTELKTETLKADVLITATGRHGIIQPDMIKPGAVVVDAGVAGEKGKTVGDVAPGVYERDDITITPTKGGVGPLTVCVLFENVLKAAAQQYTSRHPEKYHPVSN